MSNAVVSIAPMQWAPLQDIDDVRPINDDDHNCLKEIYDVLKRHEKEDRFGVTLLHKHFNINENEILLEKTDIENRKLMLRVVNKDDTEMSNSIQTSWMLKGGDNIKSMTACYASCEMNIQGNHSRFHNK